LEENLHKVAWSDGRGSQDLTKKSPAGLGPRRLMFWLKTGTIEIANQIRVSSVSASISLCVAIAVTHRGNDGATTGCGHIDATENLRKFFSSCSLSPIVSSRSISTLR
jgi:hypothetical protein